MAKVTIRDVALAAGVGIGTVSRVLNNNANVSERTRSTVLEAIETLGFVPNAAARQLPRKKPYQAIGVITRPFTEYYSFAERLRGVHRALEGYSDTYELVLYNTYSTLDYNERLESIIENSMMLGLLVLDFNLSKEQKEAIRQSGIPFVGVNHVKAKDWPCIGTDNEIGGEMATEHLLSLGHRRIAYVGNDLIDPDGFSTSKERYLGYLNALEKAGVEQRPEYFRVGAMGYEPARLMTLDILRLPERPTAIFAMSDTQALGCMAAARELGLRVPEDLSVMGYDDVEFSNHIGISTVRQHLELSGEVGMRYLLRLIAREAPERLQSLPSLEVIPRRTTSVL
jgi:DNA-binding LacI/PurR family transcriptional regulator